MAGYVAQSIILSNAKLGLIPGIQNNNPQIVQWVGHMSCMWPTHVLSSTSILSLSLPEVDLSLSTEQRVTSGHCRVWPESKKKKWKETTTLNFLEQKNSSLLLFSCCARLNSSLIKCKMCTLPLSHVSDPCTRNLKVNPYNIINSTS